MKADIFSLGCILFKMSAGKPLFTIPDKTDPGFFHLYYGKMPKYLDQLRLKPYFSKKSLSLIKGLLKIEESERFNSMEILQCDWFETYYKRYAPRIKKKSKAQKAALKQQRLKPHSFSFYYDL